MLAAAQSLGLSVPDELSVVGFNDVPVSARLPRPLTTVRVPFDQIDAAVLELLDETRAGAPARHVTVAPTLIPRSTSARPPA